MFLDIPMLISGSNADTKSEVPRGDDTLDDLEVFFILKRLETSSLQKVEQKIMPPYLSRYQLAEPEKQAKTTLAKGETSFTNHQLFVVPCKRTRT